MLPTYGKINSCLSQLHKKYGNNIPYGSYSKIANKYDVSREWVRRVARKYSFKLGRGYKLPMTKCGYCQRLFHPSKRTIIFCKRKCYSRYRYYKGNRLYSCKVCGLGIVLPLSKIKVSMTNKFYCSRDCLYRKMNLVGSI